jgi:hypothetical protein
MDHYELANGCEFVEMTKTHKNKHVITNAQLQTMLFHYYWWPTRAKGITMNTQPFYTFLFNIMFDDLSLVIWILFMFMMFVHPTNALILSSLHAQNHLNHEPCTYFLCCWHVLLGSSMKLEKSRMLKCEVQSFVAFVMGCSHPWTMMSVGHIRWGKTSINIYLGMCGQVIFGPIIGNSVCDHFQFVMFYHLTISMILFLNCFFDGHI